MQASPPSPRAASSIYDAIKDGDWEGLLALYASTAYDAVNSAKFARRGYSSGVVSYHRQKSSPSSPMAAGNGMFRDEKKLEGVNRVATVSHQGYRELVGSSFSSSSSTVCKLDIMVRQMIGAEIFDEYDQDCVISESSSSCQGQQQRFGDCKQPSRGRQQPNKKTRQHSPARKSPHGGGGLSSALEHILFHSGHQSSSPSFPVSWRGSKTEAEDLEWEKVMWESAYVLSNGRPSPGFVAHHEDRARCHKGMDRARGFDGSSSVGRGLKSIGGVFTEDDSASQAKGGEGEVNESDSNGAVPPLFEGTVANATPGDAAEGGSGYGTAQHLACLLDSPFALALLLVMGVNIEARHTAFRRLAVHEAACADSPKCLGLLMELGGRFSVDLFRCETGGGRASASPPEHPSFVSSPPLAVASTAALESFGRYASETFSSGIEDRNRNVSAGRKFGKKKSLFSKSLEVCGVLKKSISDETCERIPEFTSFPIALRVMWDAAKLLRSGEMTEADAARHVLDCVKLSGRSINALALQCPDIPPLNTRQKDRDVAVAAVAVASLSDHDHILHPHPHPPTSPSHRDVQASFVRRNVDGHGNTPLHWAAFKNSVRAMDVLLSHAPSAAVDVDARAQPSGWTPLHDAAYSDAAEAVARLIAAGATVDARSHSGATPLCFAAQEDAPEATRMLLEAGADPGARCLGNGPVANVVRANHADQTHHPHSRFSGYTPLHYCAHYDAARAARVLLDHSHCRDRQESHQLHRCSSSKDLLEIPDLNEKLPIHVAVARGSSLVLRELLHGGARVETVSCRAPGSLRTAPMEPAATSAAVEATTPLAILRHDSALVNGDAHWNNPIANNLSSSPVSGTTIITPVSSPALRAMIPSHPITSSKPWNCLSQKSIDACRNLMSEVEMSWSPDRHSLFSPADRVAVVEVMRVGKRLERVGRGIFLDLWPHVLSFCGRGWFEPFERCEMMEGGKSLGKDRGGYGCDEECSSSSLSASESLSGEDMEVSFTQFQLDGTNAATTAIL